MSKSKIRTIKAIVTVHTPVDSTVTDAEILENIQGKCLLPGIKFYNIEPLNSEE